MSPIVSRPKIEPTERRSSVERDTVPSAPTVAARPPTPPVATSLQTLSLPPSRPETPLLPEIPPRRGSVQRPTTPELPQLQPPTEREVAAVTAEVGLEEAKESPTKDAATLSEPMAAELEEQKPTLPESKPPSPRSPPLEMRRSPLASIPTGLDTVPSQIDNNPDVDAEPTAPTTSKPREIRVTIDPIVQHTLISPPANNTTIAERRSVRLPENVVPRPPSRDRFRQGSMPSARSVSSQPETPQTAEPRDDPLSGHLSDGAMEEAHEAGVITAVSTSQRMRMRLNFDALPTWNDLVGPRRPTRERVYIHRSEVTNDMDELMDVLPVMRSVESEKQHLATKVKGLRLDYRYHALDWSFHHKLLTEQMEPRGPVPPDTFVMEDMPASEHENYQGDPTIAEDGATVGRRGGRRDGLIANSDAAIDDVINRSMQLNARDPVAQSWANKAAIPDMALEGTCEYDDENDLVLDPLEFYDFDGLQEKIWTPDERAVFRRTFPNCLKQFGKIADKLPDKTVGDCVQYYYRTKKDLDWKGIVNKKGGGAPKKPKPPLPKSKGPTLLNNLDKPKTATNAANAGGRSTITPARKGQGPRIRETIGTPVDSGRRRKQSGLDSVDGQGSETSRAGSEAPAVAAKSKMRMSIKGKRPRVSSISGTPAAMSAEASVAESVDEPLPTGPPTPQMPGDPQAELLPPARRAGKKRKMTVTDGTGGSVGPEDKGDNKPKRQSTSSYWSVEEKKLVLRLLTIYPDSLEKIAEQIAGKSVRQVQNFIASRGEVSDAGPVCPFLLGLNKLLIDRYCLLRLLRMMSINNLGWARLTIRQTIHRLVNPNSGLGLVECESLRCSMMMRTLVRRGVVIWTIWMQLRTER
jgi:serine/arginine repetitive matrix protein 2